MARNTPQNSKLLLFGASLLAWLFTTQMVLAQDGSPVPKVAISAAVTEDIAEEARFLGRGEAVSKTAVVARVTGFVEEVAVADGSRVKIGDVLFRIEPDTYQANLALSQAELSGAEANLELAAIELDRREELVQRNAAPVSELDIARANEKAARAQVVAAQAALQQAELELSYTEITAPRFSRRLMAASGASKSVPAHW